MKNEEEFKKYEKKCYQEYPEKSFHKNIVKIPQICTIKVSFEMTCTEGYFKIEKLHSTTREM